MEYKNLRVGIVLKESNVRIILCIDGTFRFDKHELCKSFKKDDIVLFEDSITDDILFAIGLEAFYFYEDRTYHAEDYYDYLIRKEKGICVPKEYEMVKDRFIVDRGSGYQFVVYCKMNDVLYVDWRYTNAEKELIRSFFDSSKKKMPKDIITETENYLSSLNVDEILNSFTIRNEIIYISRPGKEDSLYVHKRSKKFDDGYVNSLFPLIDEEIYAERDYYLSPLAHDTDSRIYMDEANEFINEAKRKYNKNDHRSYLLNERFTNLITDYKREFNKTIERRLSFLSNIDQLLQNDMISEDYARELNTKLRDYYRKANNAEVDWHNFYDRITR